MYSQWLCFTKFAGAFMLSFIHQGCLVEGVAHEESVVRLEVLDQRLRSRHLSLTKDTEIT